MTALESRLKKLEGKLSPQKESDYWAQFRGLLFKDFWFRIGAPVKNGKEHGYYPYEEDLTKVLETHKYVWVKKATGLGITEYYLRYMAWLALKDDTYKGSLFCIVTGPRQDLAEDLMERIRGFFEQSPQHTKTEVYLNGVKLQAFPSNHLDSMRGQPAVKFVLLDEADFFRKGEQDNARDVAERYIAKSDPIIAMVSTPNLPGGLFDRMEHEQNSLYHRIHLPYTVGLGNIYSEEDIKKAKESPSFEREYNLKYGYGIGNVFLPQQVDACEKIPYNPDIIRRAPNSMGIDPAFGDLSQFAIVVSRLEDGHIQIVEAEQHKRPDFNDMVARAVHFIHKHGIEKVYVDGSNPELIKALKRLIGERQDYDEGIKAYDKQKVDYERVMRIVPVEGVSFGQENREMLTWAQQVVSQGQLAINSRYVDLLLQMRSAKTNEKGALDKTDVSLDLVDSLFLSLRRYGYRK